MPFTQFSKRTINQTIIYGLLICLLFLNVSLISIPNYKEFNDCLQYDVQKQDSINKEWIRYCKEKGDRYPEGKIYYYKALKIDSSIKRLSDYLEQWKFKVAQTNNNYEQVFFQNKRNGKDTVRSLLITNHGADIMLGFLNNTVGYMVNSVEDPGIKSPLLQQLPINWLIKNSFKNISYENWAEKAFYQVSPQAAITLISAIQNDLLLSESMVLQELYREGPQPEITDNFILALAVPSKFIVQPGEKAHAEIFFAWYNYQLFPVISTNHGSVKIIYHIGEWQDNAGSVGEHTILGTISATDRGFPVTKQWSFSYIVGTPDVTIQLDKMNICYLGVENPISISYPGYKAKDISLRVDGSKVTKIDSNHYSIMVKGVKKNSIYAYVDAKIKNGKTSSIGGMKIKLKEYPLPVVVMEDSKDGKIRLDDFKTQHGISLITDSDFAMTYRVDSFQLYLFKKDKTAFGPFTITGNTFSSNSDAMDAIGNAGVGDRIFITDTHVIDAIGNKLTLNPVSFSLE